MKNTLTAEWIKLRTILAHMVLAIVAVAFPVVVVTLVTIFGEFGSESQSDNIANLVVGITIVSAMILGAMSAISLTGDYSHNTIRPTYAATPDRMRVIASKLIVNSTLIAGLVFVTVAVSWLIASLVLAGRDSSISLGDGDVIATLISVVALAVFVAWFGFGLGLVIRNSPVTITLLLLWPLLIENLIGLIFIPLGWESASKWLPYQAALTAVTDDNDFDADLLGRPWGLIYFGIVSLAIIAVGAWLDQRRDA